MFVPRETINGAVGEMSPAIPGRSGLPLYDRPGSVQLAQVQFGPQHLILQRLGGRMSRAGIGDDLAHLDTRTADACMICVESPGRSFTLAVAAGSADISLAGFARIVVKSLAGTAAQARERDPASHPGEVLPAYFRHVRTAADGIPAKQPLLQRFETNQHSLARYVGGHGVRPGLTCFAVCVPPLKRRG